jgi:hypothetical protein
MCCAGLTGALTPVELGHDIWEHICMLMPLEDLRRTVPVGKVFWSVFQKRIKRPEESALMTSAAVAAFGTPLLEGVGLVLKRYLQGVSLRTGHRALQGSQDVWVDRSGSVTRVNRGSDRNSAVHARVRVIPHTPQNTSHPQTPQAEACHPPSPDGHELLICLREDDAHGALLRLSVPSSGQGQRVAPMLALDHWEPMGELRMLSSSYLGAFFLIARMAGDESEVECERGPGALKRGPEGVPVGPPFSGGGNPEEPPWGVPVGPPFSGGGNPEEPPWGVPVGPPFSGGGNPEGPPRGVPVGAPLVEGADPSQAPQSVPVGTPLLGGGNRTQTPQGVLVGIPLLGGDNPSQSPPEKKGTTRKRPEASGMAGVEQSRKVLEVRGTSSKRPGVKREASRAVPQDKGESRERRQVSFPEASRAVSQQPVRVKATRNVRLDWSGDALRLQMLLQRMQMTGRGDTSPFDTDGAAPPHEPHPLGQADEMVWQVAVAMPGQSKLVDQGLLTALELATRLHVACCHVRLPFMPQIGTCTDSRCCRKLPAASLRYAD